jgi:hypothetical protein
MIFENARGEEGIDQPRQPNGGGSENEGQDGVSSYPVYHKVEAAEEQGPEARMVYPANIAVCRILRIQHVHHHELPLALHT